MRSLMICMMTLCVFFQFSCNKKEKYSKIVGETMGTYYAISFSSFNSTITKEEIDSVLIKFNNSLSTYIPNSTISNINQSDSIYCFANNQDSYFKKIFNESKDIYHLSDGYFEPTIAPLVNYWGFGYEGHRAKSKIDTSEIEKLLSYVDFKNVTLLDNQDSICIDKNNKETKLDFSAIAKGYGIDVVSEFLDRNNIHNYLVDIGGESRAKGVNQRGHTWTLGINKPDSTADVSDILIKIILKNKSIATSGNYRNYHIVNGNVSAHIIDPMTGYSRQSEILSASVISTNCMRADALATCCMVMPIEESKKMINKLDSTEALYILSKNGNYKIEYTEGFKNYIEE